MWIERTTYVTAYRLPGILKWFEVKSVSVVRGSLDAQTELFVVLLNLNQYINELRIPARLTGGDQSFGERHRDDGEDQ